MLSGNSVPNQSIFFPPNPYPVITQRECTIADQINRVKITNPQSAPFNPGTGQAFHNYSILQFKQQASPRVQTPGIPEVKTSIVKSGAPTVIKTDLNQIVPTLIVSQQPESIIPSSQVFDLNSSSVFINQEPLVPIITPNYQQLLENQRLGVQMSIINKDPSILEHDPMMMLRDSAISKLDGFQEDKVVFEPVYTYQPVPRQDYQPLDFQFGRVSGRSRHSSHIGANMQILNTLSNSPVSYERRESIPTNKPRGIGLVTRLDVNTQQPAYLVQQMSNLHSNRNSVQSTRTIASQFENYRNKSQNQSNQIKRESIFQPQLTVFAAPQPSEAYAKIVPQLPVIPPRILQIIKTYKSNQRIKNIDNLNYQRGTSLGPYYIPSKHAYYLGQWINGLPYGFGKVIYDSNAYFQGFFVNGEAFCHDGLWIYPDNSYYIGEIRRSEPEGYGQMVYKDFDLIYKGSWKSGKPHGKGTQKFKDGSVFEGDFFNGLKHGSGKFTWSDGTFYQGEFRNGFMEGKGTKTNSNGSQFVGQFHKNLVSGEGRHITKQGQYVGEFLFNKRHGKGIFQSQNGDFFEGEFQNDLPNGKGKLMVNGKTIIGVWKDGNNVEVEKMYSNT